MLTKSINLSSDRQKRNFRIEKLTKAFTRDLRLKSRIRLGSDAGSPAALRNNI